MLVLFHNCVQSLALLLLWHFLLSKFRIYLKKLQNTIYIYIYILIAYFIQQATREAVLNRTEEHHDARMHSLQNATAVYDLLAIALVKRAQFNKLSDVSISLSNISQINCKLP